MVLSIQCHFLGTPLEVEIFVSKSRYILSSKLINITICGQGKQPRGYRIHSNKSPGHLDKSFWVGAYLFHYSCITLV